MLTGKKLLETVTNVKNYTFLHALLCEQFFLVFFFNGVESDIKFSFLSLYSNFAKENFKVKVKLF
jgi:hypothetical protein